MWLGEFRSVGSERRLGPPSMLAAAIVVRSASWRMTAGLVGRLRRWVEGDEDGERRSLVRVGGAEADGGVECAMSDGS
jgi:hypothetical protein